VAPYFTLPVAFLTMPTASQPRWHVAANLGDVNPLDHGGSFVLIDSTGIYDPELWRFNSDSMRLHRFSIEQCHRTITGAIGDNNYHPNLSAWFGSTESLRSVSSFVDNEDLPRHLCGSNVIDRAMSYMALCDYHGADSFDSYPITLTRSKARKLTDRLLAAIKSGRPFNPVTK
jgi:hypothetical protein